MNIDKIIVIPFKKTSVGNLILACTAKHLIKAGYFLPSTVTSGIPTELENEAKQYIKDEFGLESEIVIDLGISIFNKYNCQCYAILVNKNNTKSPDWALTKFVPLKESIKEFNSPLFQDFLQKFSNWNVLHHN